MSDTSVLSDREIEILKLVATGVSNKEIAHQLYISPNTVKVHLKNIFSKIGAASRTEAAMYAVQQGWVAAANPETVHLAEQEDFHISRSKIEQYLLKRWRGLPYWGIGSAVLLVFLLIAIIAVFIYQFRIRSITQNPSNTAALAGWVARAEMPTARFGLAGAVFDNQLYAIGGETSRGVSGAVERYDLGTDTWQALSSKPLATADICAGVIGGKIYIPGGRLDDGSISDQTEIFDIRADRWESGVKLPNPLSGYGCVVFEGRLYLFGGWDGNNFTDQVLEYDPGLSNWRNLSHLPSKRGFLGAAILGSKVYIIGGRDGDVILDSIDIYSIDAENSGLIAWESGPNLPEGKYAMGTTAIAEKLYAIGGVKEGNDSKENSYEYDPLENDFRLLQNPVPETWSSMVLLSQGPFIYAVGGKINSTPVDQNLRFQVIYSVALPVIR